MSEAKTIQTPTRAQASLLNEIKNTHPRIKPLFFTSSPTEAEAKKLDGILKSTLGPEMGLVLFLSVFDPGIDGVYFDRFSLRVTTNKALCRALMRLSVRYVNEDQIELGTLSNYEYHVFPEHSDYTPLRSVNDLLEGEFFTTQPSSFDIRIKPHRRKKRVGRKIVTGLMQRQYDLMPKLKKLQFNAGRIGRYAWRDLNLPLKACSRRSVQGLIREYNKRFNLGISLEEILATSTPNEVQNLIILPKINPDLLSFSFHICENYQLYKGKFSQEQILYIAKRPGLLALMATFRYDVHWDDEFRQNNPNLKLFGNTDKP